MVQIKPDRFWEKEIMEDCRSKKALAMKFLLPLLLLSPLAFGHVPDHIKAWILSVAVLFTGTFGSAVGLAQIRESRMLEKLAVTPVSPRRIIADYMMASMLMDGLQLMVPFVLVAGLTTSRLPMAMACYVAALVAASALGVIVAVMAGSSAEVHLYAALAVLVSGALSNPVIAYEPLGYLNMAWPFWQLSNALIGSGSNSQSALALISAGVMFYLAMIASVRMFRLRD